MTKLKPQWMVSSYARKSKRQTYGDASGHARYGGGTLGNHTDVKSSTGQRTRTTVDSSLTLASANLNKNYSRLDDEDVEQAMRMPAPMSMAYRRNESSDSVNIFSDAARGSEHEGVQMQQLQPRPNKSRQGSANDKAMEVLGMGSSKAGVSTTQVVGGKNSTSSSRSGDSSGGIEVKRDVFITTQPMPDRQERRQ